MNTFRRVFHFAFYVFIVGSLRLLLTTAARVRVLRTAPLPSGAFVMASNHISHFDPPFLSGWIPRKIEWIAMVELFGTRWSRAGFTWLDVIPVDRTGDDRHALREALRRLDEGRVIGVFPEGGIRDGDQSLLAGAPCREGALLLSVRSGRPLVPVAILGSERLYNKRNWLSFRRAAVYIGIGAAIFPDATLKGGARAKLRADFEAALLALRDQMVATYGLTANDMPHSPQQRMREP